MLSIVLYMKCPLAYKCNVNWPGKQNLTFKSQECKDKQRHILRHQ